LFEEFPNDIAALILEPVVGNMGLVPPLPEFLPGLRQLTKEYGALLVFDEVMTGFRVHPGGAQTLFDIKPDLTALGKVIGGGLPVGAYGGRRDVMEMVAPIGPMYQAGTLSGNPLAMTAGIATIRGLTAPGVWEQMEERGERLMQGLHAAAEEQGIAVSHSRVGTMFGLFFNEGPVVDWPSAKKSDTQLFARYFQSMLAQGVYVAPSQFEAGFLSTAHGDHEIEATINAAARTFASLKD
jgi:glutamate-1-semialdehyde 2,1-aminomutase